MAGYFSLLLCHDACQRADSEHMWAIGWIGRGMLGLLRTMVASALAAVVLVTTTARILSPAHPVRPLEAVLSLLAFQSELLLASWRSDAVHILAGAPVAAFIRFASLWYTGGGLLAVGKSVEGALLTHCAALAGFLIAFAVEEMREWGAEYVLGDVEEEEMLIEEAESRHGVEKCDVVYRCQQLAGAAGRAKYETDWMPAATVAVSMLMSSVTLFAANAAARCMAGAGVYEEGGGLKVQVGLAGVMLVGMAMGLMVWVAYMVRRGQASEGAVREEEEGDEEEGWSEMEVRLL
ncbi:hypothetical protein HK101_005918 [Irineochytrium annulatum]|nr:hypothetical protein HK101_005918 [Irineochytrium annulatum]